MPKHLIYCYISTIVCSKEPPRIPPFKKKEFAEKRQDGQRQGRDRPHEPPSPAAALGVQAARGGRLRVAAHSAKGRHSTVRGMPLTKDLLFFGGKCAAIVHQLLHFEVPSKKPSEFGEPGPAHMILS